MRSIPDSNFGKRVWLTHYLRGKKWKRIVSMTFYRRKNTTIKSVDGSGLRIFHQLAIQVRCSAIVGVTVSLSMDTLTPRLEGIRFIVARTVVSGHGVQLTCLQKNI